MSDSTPHAIPGTVRAYMPNTRFYRLLQILSRACFALLTPVRTFGVEHIPRDGPLIIVANHASYVDPVVMGATCPRPTVFMAKKELWESVILRNILYPIGVVP